MRSQSDTKINKSQEPSDSEFTPSACSGYTSPEITLAARTWKLLPCSTLLGFTPHMTTAMSPRRNTSKGTSRSLKPAVEKKRRDRINQSLDELRTLLLSHTLDTRLQNPKLEKAEILELTVEYIRNRTMRETTNHNSDSGVPAQSGDGALSDVGPQERAHMKGAPPSGSSLYCAGFQQCVSRLSTFMDCVNPAQRRSIAQGLQHYLGPPSPPDTEGPPRPENCANVSGPSYSLALYPSPMVLPHPYPSPPYSLSPPPSPCYASASPTGHFLFPPTLSPPTSDSSSCSSSPPLPALCPPFPVLLAPPPAPSATPTPLRPAVLPPLAKAGQRGVLRRELFPRPSNTVWRPWS
ncbi:hypothetical protein GJAV_G00126980 [Gymnothorax javanicus]|nr:hypothetical protein GJAV_G00126980 [Gymnothorax javanicus]